MPDTEHNERQPPVDSSAAQLRRAIAAVQDMRSRLEAIEAKRHEAIALVGMACRFPGGDDPAQWWQTLVNGRDAVGLVPEDRWDREALYDPDPDAPGKMNTRWGGFITEIDRFDAAFFGISPREAVGIDPQQRLLLETTWHALEDAALAPDRLAGSRSGVYVGMSTNDYARILSADQGAEWIDAHASMGNAVSVAAGRISYTLGLQGPSMVIDTACSSSLVAVHQAMQALRSGEIALGIAAGVNLVLLPELTIGFSKARMMAADGHCKTFDAAADGYVRGEGCGVIVLKRLSDALADGDRIHALLLGSAVNHDGRSNGLTAPNGPAQVAVIRAALADAQITPEQVSCIEAHGTGTALGDPIEARALANVYGGERLGTPLPMLASVKTQIGHLEAAAGMAGLIKLVLALQAKTIPPHLHFRALNPHIAEDGFPFRIPEVATPWLPVAGRWIGGVSSFGFSGTNAHLIVEAAPNPADEAKTKTRSCEVLPLSARDLPTLEILRERVMAALRAQNIANIANIDFPAFAATLGAGRAHHACRLAVVAKNPATALEALGKAQAKRTGEAPQIAFLFTGQGCQYPGMARGLLAEPRFRATLQRCDAVLGAYLGRPIADLLAVDAGVDLSRTDLLQPLLFAIEYAVADLWRAWGIEPAAVIGHSLGEIAAACFAGAIELEPALRFVAERGRLMQTCAGRGTMAAVLAPAEQVAEVMGEIIKQGTAVIAAYNAPKVCSIAGEPQSIAAAGALFDQAGIAWQALEVSTGFHSAALDSCLDELERAAACLPTTPARLPIASNLHGKCIHSFDAGYWRHQAREPVRFTAGMQALLERGCRVFLEVGPHPVLSGFGRALAPEATFVASLRRGADDEHSLADALAQLYMLGARPDWRARLRPGQRRAAAPCTPFLRERHWPVQKAPSAAARREIRETLVSTANMPYLAEHVVFGEIVAPGAMHAVTALAALCAESAKSAATPAIEDLIFEQALKVPETGIRSRLRIGEDGAFSLSALDEYGKEMRGKEMRGEEIRYASGRAFTHTDERPAALDWQTLQAGMQRDEAGPEALFTMLAERGIALGPAFRGTRAVWRGAGEALAEIVLPEILRTEAGSLPIHPAMLDACFQTLGTTFAGEGVQGGFLPLSVDRIRVWEKVPERIFCHVRSGAPIPGAPVAVGDFTLCDPSGRILMTVDGLQIRRIASADPADPERALADACLAPVWQPLALGEADWANPDALAAAARSTLPEVEERTENSLADALERLAEAYAADALDELDKQGSSTDATAVAAGIAPTKTRLLRRVRQLAAQHRATAARPASGNEQTQALRAAHPENHAEIDLVARCGGALAAVLRGEADPLQLIFPDGETGENGENNVYGGSGLAHTANALAAAALAAAIARRKGRALRIIEIGAGTGATTELILPHLAEAPGSSYLFTDISPAFLKGAQARFGDAIETALFDLEKSPEAQGLAVGSFDVVIAANVVHATADVRASLATLRTLLTPGGALLLVESTQAQQWWDVVFGLTDGWWRFTDTDLRPDHPLLDAAAWQGVLAEAGFTACASVAADSEARLSLLTASAPHPAVLLVHDGRDGPALTLAEALAGEFGRRGVACDLLDADAAIEQLARPLSGDEDRQRCVVYTGGIGSSTDSTAADRLPLQQAFALIRAMLQDGREGLYLVTRGAHGPAPVVDPDNASLWGVGEVAALEHPELKCRRIDLDPVDAQAAAHLADEVLIDNAMGRNSGTESESASGWKEGVRHVRRLVEAALPGKEGALFEPGRSCLVTGAFGGLGPLLAEWLVAQGADTLVLLGRHPPEAALEQRLRQLKATVHLRCADVADPLAMQALFDELNDQLPPLGSIFHLAGSVADGALLTQDWDRFSAVLRAKADGARLLDRLSDTPALRPHLRHFVLFSSSASLIGNLGQANHAAANACMDALAHNRRNRGLPALSINWGAWAEAGAVVAGEHLAAMAERGVKTIPPAAGFAALGRAMRGKATQLGIVPLDWPTFLAGYGERVPPFFSVMAARAPATTRASARPAASGRAAATQASPTSIDLRRLLAETPAENRMARLEDFLRGTAAEVLGMADVTRIDPDHPLNELGLDSLLALELRNRIGAAIGARQPATLLFNYTTVAALARHFAGELLPDGGANPEGAAPDGQDVPAEQGASADEINEITGLIAGLSEAELEALIDEELRTLEKP